MTTPLPLAEVKAHLSELVGRVHDQHERVLVTVHGKPSVVLVAVDDLEALEQTIDVLSDREMMQDLAHAHGELAAGDVAGEAELASLMKQRLDDATS